MQNRINELSKILLIETEEKNQIVSNLEETEKKLDKTSQSLKNQESLSKSLQSNLSDKESKLFIQDQNIMALSERIKELLSELRIVANALETYEGAENYFT